MEWPGLQEERAALSAALEPFTAVDVAILAVLVVVLGLVGIVLERRHRRFMARYRFLGRTSFSYWDAFWATSGVDVPVEVWTREREVMLRWRVYDGGHRKSAAEVTGSGAWASRCGVDEKGGGKGGPPPCVEDPECARPAC